MSDTGKRNSDTLNNISIVVVGIVGAVLVYVSITLLQAFYMDDSAGTISKADYDGQENTARSLRADQLSHIDTPVKNAGKDTFVIPIATAMALVVEDAKKDPANLIPAVGRSDKSTIAAEFGRPKPLAAAASAAPATPTPADGAGPTPSTPTPVSPVTTTPTGSPATSVTEGSKSTAPAPSPTGGNSTTPAGGNGH